MSNAQTDETSDNSAWLIRSQRKLGAPGLIVMLVLANTIIPFSTDMYTPALPSLPEYFGTSEALANLTIVLFFAAMTLSVLGFGPVSDRFGRKPVMVGGLGAYAVGSLCCAFSWSIESLIAFRVVQAAGAGAATAVSIALVKDCFAEHRREQMFALIQVLGVVGPVAAPLVGGLILTVADWRTIFMVLAVLGGACLALSFLLEEALDECDRRQGGVVSTLRGLVDVGKNPSFMVFLMVAAIVMAPFMGYLVAAPYIYIDFFGETPQGYSYYFAIASVFTGMGPIVWLRASRYMTPRSFTNIIIAVSILVGVLLLTIGSLSAPLFCACFILFAMGTAALRPYATNILLAQQSRDTGSASSLVNFMYNVCGVLGMALALIPWPSYIVGLGIIVLVLSLVAAALWLLLLKSDKLHIRELDC